MVSWSNAEMRIFKKHYNRVQHERIRELLPNKSNYAIRDMATRMGWRVDGKKRDLSVSEREWLHKNWPYGGLALGDAVRKLNVGVTILRRVGKELGLKTSNPDSLFSEQEKELMSKLLDRRYSVEQIRDVFYYRSLTVLIPRIKKALFTIDKTKLHRTVRDLKCI